MSDPPSKPGREDDPVFLASLNDLDRGLDEDGSDRAGDVAGERRPEPPVRTVPPSPLPAPPADAARLVPAGTFGDADDPPPPLTFTRPNPGDARTRRPLLDLFPESAHEHQGPRPAMGTAVGPQLPPRARPTSTADASGRSRDDLTLEAFYGLRERAFSLSTDPKFQYPSAACGRASREVLAAIGQRRGPVVLTGALGMGKTTLCRVLAQDMARRTATSLVLEPLQSLDTLLSAMLVDFGVVAREELAGASAPTRPVLASRLNAFLESLVPLQAGAVVFIDEAQNVPASVLAELDGLGPAGGAETRVLQLVLVGQPALTALLEQPDLRALNASVARRAQLGPLAADEIAPYVMHRLSIAGATTRIEFDAAAVALLFELSDGSPRIVNLLCDRAMVRGRAASAVGIGRELIEEAATDLDLGEPTVDRSHVLGTALFAAAFVALVLAGAVGALWVSRDAVNRAILQWEQVPLPPGGPVRALPVPLPPIVPPTAAPSDARSPDAPSG